MKFILLVGTLVVGGDSGQTAAESSTVYANAEACTKAVEIRTGYPMSPTKGGYKSVVEITNINNRRIGKTTFVCSPYGEE